MRCYGCGKILEHGEKYCMVKSTIGAIRYWHNSVEKRCWENWWTLFMKEMNKRRKK